MVASEFIGIIIIKGQKIPTVRKAEGTSTASADSDHGKSGVLTDLLPQVDWLTSWATEMSSPTKTSLTSPCQQSRDTQAGW